MSDDVIIISGRTLTGTMFTVIYESQNGSTKRYAEKLASSLGCGCFPLSEAIPKGRCGDVIFLGWRSGPVITGLKDALQRYDVKAAVCVGLLELNDKDLALMRKKNGFDNIFGVLGSMDRSGLGFGQKLILGIVSIKMRIFDRTPELIEVRRIMDHGGDLSSDDQLDPVIAWAESQ